MLGDVAEVAVALRGRGSAASLGTAVERGGTTMTASGWRELMLVVTPSWS